MANKRILDSLDELYSKIRNKCRVAEDVTEKNSAESLRNAFVAHSNTVAVETKNLIVENNWSLINKLDNIANLFKKEDKESFLGYMDRRDIPQDEAFFYGALSYIGDDNSREKVKGIIDSYYTERETSIDNIRAAFEVINELCNICEMEPVSEELDEDANIISLCKQFTYESIENIEREIRTNVRRYSRSKYGRDMEIDAVGYLSSPKRQEKIAAENQRLVNIANSQSIRNILKKKENDRDGPELGD